MLKNLHKPKKLVIFTLVKGVAIYHTTPNGKTGNTYTYTKEKRKKTSYDGIGCLCGTIPRHTA